MDKNYDSLSCKLRLNEHKDWDKWIIIETNKKEKQNTSLNSIPQREDTGKLILTASMYRIQHIDSEVCLNAHNDNTLTLTGNTNHKVLH